MKKFVSTNKITQLQNQISDWLEQDKQEIVSLFSKLVQCNTSSDVGDTRSAMRLIKQFLDKEHLSYDELKVNEIMPNIITTTEMAHSGRHLMFNGHLDVMPAGNEPGWTDDPWSGKVSDGKVWGRGTSDMKAGVTAMLFSYMYLTRMRSKLSGRLSLTLVSDEETGYERGTGYMFEQIEEQMMADCVLSAEPSGPNTISFASKGYIQFTIQVKTRGAIAGYSNESPSAINIASSIINELKELEKIEVVLPEKLSKILNDPHWRDRYESARGKGELELLSKVTVDITTIKGGDLISVAAPDCSFTAAVVIPVGTDPYHILAKARKILARYPEAELLLDGISMADISSPEHEMVKILQDTVEGLGYDRPVPVPDIAISDCRHWRYRDVPAFWYGADGSRCSAANEYVAIDELLHLIRTYTIASIQYLENQNIQSETKDVSDTSPQIMNDLPKLQNLPPVYAAYLTGSAKSFSSKDLDPVVDKLLDTLYGRLTKEGVLTSATALTIMEQEKVKGKSQVKITVAFPVERTVVASGGVETMEIPSEESVAVMVCRGEQDTTKSWSQLTRWASKQGYKNKGIYREYYVVNEPNPQRLWITELQFPLKK